jgi:hypothetical protein
MSREKFAKNKRDFPIPTQTSGGIRTRPDSPSQPHYIPTSLQTPHRIIPPEITDPGIGHGILDVLVPKMIGYSDDILPAIQHVRGQRVL